MKLRYEEEKRREENLGMGNIYSPVPLLPPVYSSSPAYGIPIEAPPRSRKRGYWREKMVRFKTIGICIAA